VSARASNKAINKLRPDFIPLPDGAQPNSKEGVYIEGFFIEGARWDKLDECLIDADPMTLIGEMPKFHIKAVEKEKKSKKRKGKGKDGLKYTCPVYMYPIRADTVEDPSYMFSINLKSGKGGKIDPLFWIMRGTAMLMSTGD
jgi:dynein heavy chain